MQWNLVRKPNNWLSPMEKRTAGDLRPYITHAPVRSDLRPTGAELTEAGQQLLASWNDQYGEVQP